MNKSMRTFLIMLVVGLVASGSFAVEWPLPTQGQWTTTLSERPARFWELEVKADTPGVDYHSRFLLPIYVRP